jgi:hypothetical protein
MGLESYGIGNSSSLIVCDECRSTVSTTVGALSAEEFAERAAAMQCSRLLAHAAIVRAHAFASGWSTTDEGVWRCGRCTTGSRKVHADDESPREG